MNYIEVTTTGIVTQVKTYSTILTVEEVRKAIKEGEEVQTIGDEIACDFIDEEVLHANAKYLDNDLPEEDKFLFVDEYKRREAAENADELLEALKSLLQSTSAELWLYEQKTINAMTQAKQLINRIELTR